MRLSIVILGVIAFVTMSGCVSQNVALVTDVDSKAPKVSDSLSHLLGPDQINKNDRLVILRISYKNPLLFKNSVQVSQHPRGKTGRSLFEIYFQDKTGSTLVLLKFKADAGDTAHVQPKPCVSVANATCYSLTAGFDETYLNIGLPPSGKVAYAGRLYYELVDQFPHRGTQNYPIVKNMKLENGYDQDVKVALQKWPTLKHRKIGRSIASIQSGIEGN